MVHRPDENSYQDTIIFMAIIQVKLPAHSGNPGQRAVKWLLLFLYSGKAILAGTTVKNWSILLK